MLDAQQQTIEISGGLFEDAAGAIVERSVNEELARSFGMEFGAGERVDAFLGFLEMLLGGSEVGQRELQPRRDLQTVFRPCDKPTARAVSRYEGNG